MNPATAGESAEENQQPKLKAEDHENFMQIIGRLAAGCVLALCLVSNAHAQLQFTDVRVDQENAIRLSWVSETNALYRIDYAPELTEPMNWKSLYEWYPAHGTSTFWADAGSDLLSPDVKPPDQDAMRFYRVVQIDTNDAAFLPTVAIASPTNNALLTDFITNVTVSVAWTSSVDGIRLFLDGQEVKRGSGETTNYSINTCQWANGPHTFFAVVENSDGGESTQFDDDNLKMNFAVTPYRVVEFSNFIYSFKASSRFLHPQNSETQTFTAKFLGNAIWTLTILDDSSNAVRTVTGTNTSMTFDWDGTDDSSATLPDGRYHVVLSATETDEQLAAMSSGGTEFSREIFYDAETGEEYYLVEPPPLPPPLDKERGPQPWIKVVVSRPGDFSANQTAVSSTSGSESNGPQDNGGGRSQTTVLDPPRILNLFGGTFGIAYQGHHPGKSEVGLFAFPPNAPFFPQIGLAATNPPWGRLRSLSVIARNFSFWMQNRGWSKKFILADDDLHAEALRSAAFGGSNVFNEVNLGLLIGHGARGTTGDFTISGNGPLQSYYGIYQTGASAYDWVRLSQCSFGSANLRWMGLLTCNNLHASVYDDCYNKLALPINDDLHLLLGCSAYSFMVGTFGTVFAEGLVGGEHSPHTTVKEAWFLAGIATQGDKVNKKQQTVTFRVAGWPNCFGDTVYEYQIPDSGDPEDIEYEDRQVYPYP